MNDDIASDVEIDECDEEENAISGEFEEESEESEVEYYPKDCFRCVSFLISFDRQFYQYG